MAQSSIDVMVRMAIRKRILIGTTIMGKDNPTHTTGGVRQTAANLRMQIVAQDDL
jgi:hypothetical protein